MTDIADGTRQRPDPTAQLQSLGLSLPEPRPPVANFVPAVIEGNLVYLSGQGPVGPAGIVYQGKLGVDLSIEDGYAAARLTTLNLLAVLSAMIGDLQRVRRIVRFSAW